MSGSQRLREFFTHETIHVTPGGVEDIGGKGKNSGPNPPPPAPPKNGRPWLRVLLAAGVALAIGITALSPKLPIGPANLPAHTEIKIEQQLTGAMSEQSRYVEKLQGSYASPDLPVRVFFIDRDTVTLGAGVAATNNLNRDTADIVQALLGTRAHVTVSDAQADQLAADLLAPGATSRMVGTGDSRVCAVVPTDANTRVLDHLVATTGVNADALQLMGIDLTRIGMSADEARSFLDHRAASQCIADQIYPASGTGETAQYQRHRAAVYADVLAALKSARDGYPQTARKMAFHRSISTGTFGPAYAGTESSWVPVINYSENPLYETWRLVAQKDKGVGWRNLSRLSEGQLETLAHRITDGNIMSQEMFVVLHRHFQDPAGTAADLAKLRDGHPLRLMMYVYENQMTERLTNFVNPDKQESIETVKATLAEEPGHLARHAAARALDEIIEQANKSPDGLVAGVTAARDHLRQEQNLGHPNSDHNQAILRMIDRWLADAAAKDKADAAPAAEARAAQPRG